MYNYLEKKKKKNVEKNAVKSAVKCRPTKNRGNQTIIK